MGRSKEARGAKLAAVEKATTKLWPSAGPPGAGRIWDLVKRIVTGRVVRHTDGRRGVVGASHYTQAKGLIDDFYMVRWDGTVALAASESWVPGALVASWLTDEFANEDFVDKKLLDWQENNWHPLGPTFKSKRDPPRKDVMPASGPAPADYDLAEPAKAKKAAKQWARLLEGGAKGDTVLSVATNRRLPADLCGVKGDLPVGAPDGDGDDFPVTAILDERTQEGMKLYLVKWQGYELDVEGHWEPLENLNCKALLTAWNKRRPAWWTAQENVEAPMA